MNKKTKKNLDEQEFRKLCSDGKVEEVRKLLQNQQLNINCQDNDGETPFYIACEYGHIDIVKLLLNDKRISIRKKTNQGKTAFDIAKTNNHSEVMKLIKEIDTGISYSTINYRTKLNSIKIEQRYQEYLETFQNFPFFCIENEIINQQDFLILNEYLKKNKKIRELKLFIFYFSSFKF